MAGRERKKKRKKVRRKKLNNRSKNKKQLSDGVWILMMKKLALWRSQRTIMMLVEMPKSKCRMKILWQ